jgi:hypothetical protein
MISRFSTPAVLAIASIAVFMLLASGPGTRAELWDFRTGFYLLRYGAWVGGAAAVLALLFLVIPRTRRGKVAPLALALIVGLVCLALPLQFRARASTVPPINDISTDLSSAKFPDEQKKGYPDLRALDMSVPPAAAYPRALAAARAMGWEIVRDDAKAGVIEAVDTTFWFGFKDDITVRVAAAGAGSRVDVRSRSRVGRSDLGTNARRIRMYLQRLQ